MHSLFFSIQICWLISYHDVIALSGTPQPIPQSHAKVRSGTQLFDDLMQRFQGDFDNYNQVVSDREKDLTPGPGGGHEHIHCTLVPECMPLSVGTSMDEDGAFEDCYEGQREAWILAAYYFDALPNRIFRFRVYQLLEQDDCEDVVMKLFTLSSSVEGMLRKESSEPLRWWEMINDYRSKKDGTSKYDFCEILSGCDVLWRRDADKVRHAYLFSNGDSIMDHAKPIPSIKEAVAHAYMVNPSIEIDSQMVPGVKLRIKDELSLWDEELWINDRGFDLEGNFVYGNQRGFPYRLERVTEIVGPRNLFVDDIERRICDESLKWTLGPSFRTDDTLNWKLDQIGGFTSKMNA